jgi:hypothetical protein
MIPTANTNATFFDPSPPRLPPLADLEFIEEKTAALRPSCLVFSWKVSFVMNQIVG